jgi:hypothetical protein
MASSRRQFLLHSAAAFAASSFESVFGDDDPLIQPNIRELLLANGFDPDLPGSALMAVIADIHIDLNPTDPKFTDQIPDSLVSEINGLQPGLTDIALAGDLIVHNSVVIGAKHSQSAYELSRQEFRRVKEEIKRFRSDARLWAVPGNHDTEKDEADAELWREELRLPPYQSTSLGGVPVFFLNSGHAGMLDDVQLAWFRANAAAIPSTQEVLIVAHHPSFYYRFEETGLKRVVFEAFRKHSAPVWIIGGHGHTFGEQMFVNGQRRFIQMEVTAGNPKQFSDGKCPGYVLIGLQNGRVSFRAYRSIVENKFVVKSEANRLQVYPLTWAFDVVQWPAVLFEEGFYNRAGKLVSFTGIDLKTHIILCRIYTVRLDLSRTGGRISTFLLSAYINSAFQAPTCGFSFTGLDGSWVEVPYSKPANHGVYRVTIPPIFRNSPSLYIRTKTQLQGNYDGISVCGWGLEADEAQLTGYEKWLATHYRTILDGGATSPDTKPPGSTLTNVEHYAFQIPLPLSNAPVTAESLAQNSTTVASTPPITGTPAFSRVYRTIMAYRFARRKTDFSPNTAYIVEISSNLRTWTELEDESLTITSLDELWEEVSYITTSVGPKPLFCRTRVESLEQPGSPSYIRAGDHDGDGMDDLLEFAFDLQTSSNRTRAYDPTRSSGKAGIPIQSTKGGIYNRLVFPRLRDQSNPGIRYKVQESRNLILWSEVPPNMMSVRVLRSSGDFDEVEAIMLESTGSRKFYKVVVEPTVALAT